MPSHYVPYTLLGMLVAVELYAGRVRRSDAQGQVDWSFAPLVLLIGAGYWLAFYISYSRAPGPYLAEWVVWAAAVIGVAGAALRVWSVATLGRYFTYVVRVSPDQKVVDTGPYRLIRHPSYTGALLMGAGIGLSIRHAWAPLIIVATSFVAYVIRMLAEEKALAKVIGEPYRAYMRRTKRLVPYVW